MSFFDSEIVKEEMQNISALSKKSSENLLDLSEQSNEEIKQKVDVLQAMIDKTKIFCMRLSLVDDPEAKQLSDQLQKCASIMGKKTIMEALEEVQQRIDSMKEQLDKS
jgi:hypothetical protein